VILRTDEAGEAGADHHDADGGQEDADDLGRGLGPSLPQDFHDPPCVREDEIHDKEVDDKGDKCGEISILVHAQEDGSEGSGTHNEGDADGDDPYVHGAGTGAPEHLLREEEVCNGNDEENEAAGDLKIVRRDPQGSEDDLAQHEETYGDGKGCDYGLPNDLSPLLIFHPEGEGEEEGKNAYDINGDKEGNKSEEVVRQSVHKRREDLILFFPVVWGNLGNILNCCTFDMDLAVS